MNSKLNSTNRIFFYLVSLLFFLEACESKNKNHLSQASSPYLQQHSDNPVDWHEWGDEALRLAKKENKPLLISIGYASCHWCHVMEKESFMDTAVARIMNENFVCIKVDREERPDIDNIYINACQLISGNSGWPLNAFALPDGKPFFAGTYYSTESWKSLLKKIATAYKDQNAKIILQAKALTNGIAGLDISSLKTEEQPGTMTKGFYKNVFDSVYKQLDLVNGGLKGSPKFPMPSTIEFLLQYASLTGDKNSLTAATNTLTKLALGGIYDHVGGGFARYATDTLWRVPHFEKMLYDNGQLLSVYAHAYQLTHNDLFKNVVKEIAAFVERDLSSKQGGVYSSLNADTRSGEGEFYAWEYEELKKITGASNEMISSYYNISKEGNWKKNKNLIYASNTPDEFAKKNDLNPVGFQNLLINAKKNLLAERNKREKPARDEKILTAWNALMLKGYTDAYATLGEESFLNKAVGIAKFIEKNLLQKDGQLFRNYKDGKASIPAFLDDYALLAKAYIRLYQLTFDKHWLTIAQHLTDLTIKYFYDPKTGMFFYTADNTANLVVRKMELADNVIPSSNAVMAEVLIDLYIYFESKDYLSKATRMVSRISNQMISETAFHTQWGFVAGMLAMGTYEVAIMGKDAVSKNLELQKHYLPECIFMGATGEENLPLLKNKLSTGKTLIYVCTNRTCKMPVEEPRLALDQLKKNNKLFPGQTK